MGYKYIFLLMRYWRIYTSNIGPKKIMNEVTMSVRKARESKLLLTSGSLYILTRIQSNGTSLCIFGLSMVLPRWLSYFSSHSNITVTHKSRIVPIFGSSVDSSDLLYSLTYQIKPKKLCDSIKRIHQTLCKDSTRARTPDTCTLGWIRMTPVEVLDSSPLN